MIKKIFWIFVLLVFISPWLLILVRNSNLMFPYKEKVISIKDPVLIDKVNNLRGEINKLGFGLLGKLLVNKYAYFGKEIANRYLETFDPHYLFFTGEANLIKSTQAAGPLYLSFLPLILYGIYNLASSRKVKYRNWIFFILLVSPIPASFIYLHYETISRFFFFLVLTFFVAYAFVKLSSKKKLLVFLFVVLILFEAIRFYHDFSLHYPRRLAEQIYSLPKK